MTVTQNSTTNIGCAEVRIENLLEAFEYLDQYGREQLQRKLDTISVDSVTASIESNAQDTVKRTCERMMRRVSTKRFLAQLIVEAIRDDHTLRSMIVRDLGDLESSG